MVGLWCLADRVWWAALCQKVQGHFLAAVRPWLALLICYLENKKRQIKDNYNILLFFFTVTYYTNDMNSYNNGCLYYFVQPLYIIFTFCHVTKNILDRGEIFNIIYNA